MDIKAAIAQYFRDDSVLGVSGTQTGSAIEVWLSGPLDLEGSGTLQALLCWIVDHQESQSKLLIDLEHVGYISSTGVGALTQALTAARKRNTHFVLRNLQPKVRSIFMLLGLMDYFEEEAPHA
jgi:anti-anti-sigma factor